MSTPAGWYRNPDGTRTLRWWDGLNWSAYVTDGRMQYVAVPKPPAPKAPAGTSGWTLPIWLIAATPLVGILLSLLGQLIEPSTTIGLIPTLSVWGIASSLVSWAVIALTIALAVFDRRELSRREVPKPFHWAWAFFAIINAPVYVIGRGVVSRRRTGEGLAPMWTFLGLWILDGIVSLTIVGSSVGDVLSQFGAVAA